MEGCWFLLVSLSGSYLAGIEANFFFTVGVGLSVLAW